MPRPFFFAEAFAILDMLFGNIRHHRSRPAEFGPRGWRPAEVGRGNEGDSERGWRGSRREQTREAADEG